MAGLVLVGTVTGLGSRMAGNPNSDRGQWEEHTIVVLAGMYTHEVKIGNRDKFLEKCGGELPAAGDAIALEVGVDVYLKRDGKAAYKYVAFGRDREIERAMAAALSGARA